MLIGKQLEFQRNQHVVLILGNETRKRYVVEKITPQRQSVLVRAFEPSYRPTYQRTPEEACGFSDYYRLKSRYALVLRS